MHFGKPIVVILIIHVSEDRIDCINFSLNYPVFTLLFLIQIICFYNLARIIDEKQRYTFLTEVLHVDLYKDYKVSKE